MFIYICPSEQMWVLNPKATQNRMKHRRGIVFRQNLQQLKSDNKATELRMLTTQEVKIYKAKKSKVPKDCYFTSKYFRKISMFLVKREHRKLKSADRKESCLKT